MKAVFVTGGNSGIGLALCKQLAMEDGCYVFMGSRSMERGQAALESLAGAGDKIEVVQCDVADARSIAAAAKTVKARLSSPLYALVNNAGTGLSHEGVSADQINDTNFYGTKQMVDAFLPLIHPNGGRIINVSSGGGPMWLAKESPETQELLTSGTMDIAAIDKCMKENRNQDKWHAYCLSKCLLCVYTERLAKDRPKIISSSVSPGFIDTVLVKSMGGDKKTPEEGTVSIRHCLFKELEGNGFFYGSDAVRSPFYPIRSPGQKPFTGTYPWKP